MITIRRQLLGLGFVAASSLLALHSAHALTGPTAITIDGGPLGSLSLSGGADGYAYAVTDTAPGQQTVGANIENALIQLQKTSGVLQFNIEVGSTASLTLGAPSFDGRGHISETSVNTFDTGPLYIGSITVAPPNSPVTVTAGHIASLEGYEATVDWYNPSQLATDIFFVQNSNATGVQANLTEGPVSVAVQFGDGFDTNVWNFAQALVTYTIDSNNVLNVYGAANLGRTGLNAHTYGGDTVAEFGPNYINSDMLGAFYSYTIGSLNVVPEVQYVFAKVDHQVGIDKSTANLGAAVFGTYSFANTPYSIGGWVEYEKSQGSQFTWFVGPNSEAIGAAISPTWQYKYLFARANAGAIYLLNNSASGPGTTFGYGSNGLGKFQFTGTLEAGLLF
jgi:hypothetical protein